MSVLVLLAVLHIAIEGQWRERGWGDGRPGHAGMNNDVWRALMLLLMLFSLLLLLLLLLMLLLLMMVCVCWW